MGVSLKTVAVALMLWLARAAVKADRACEPEVSALPRTSSRACIETCLLQADLGQWVTRELVHSVDMLFCINTQSQQQHLSSTILRAYNGLQHGVPQLAPLIQVFDLGMQSTAEDTNR